MTSRHPRGVISPAGRLGVPRLPPGHVVRTRCLRLLDDAATAPLALLVAGAGWGKTGLLTSWVERNSAIWVTLAPELGEREAFWGAIALALDRAGVATFPPAATGASGYPLALANSLALRREPLRLILDEFDHVRDPTVASDLEKLLQHGDDRLSIVIASRVEPAFRLQRLRLSGLLAELRAAELAFSLDEAALLFEQHGVTLPPADVQLLWERTEGWPAGLGLAALALRRMVGKPSALRALSDAEQPLHEYLLDEVVQSEQPRRLDLLLRGSLLASIDGELGAALTGSSDASQLLAELSREGFLTELEGSGSYRCHALLRDVLRTELTRRLGDELPELHRRVAQILARRGELFGALQHAIAAADWDHTAALLGEHWLDLILDGGSAELITLIEQVPPAVIRGDAELALAAAGLALERGDDRDADDLLPLVDQLTPALPEARRIRTIVSATAVELYRARSAGDVESSLQLAYARLGDDWQRRVGRGLRALALANLGASEFWAGEYDAAGIQLEQAVALAEAGGNDYLLFAAQSYAVGVDLVGGRLEDVRRGTLAVEELARARGWLDVPHGAIAYMSLAAAHMWADELDEAERRAEQAGRAADGPRDRLPYLAVVQLRATLLGLRGDAAGALELLRRAHATAGPLPRPLELSGLLLEADLR
ncbi:MAG TPA: hypothetical protein VI111_04595, partial [Thermoleophilaceae bacterium]